MPRISPNKNPPPQMWPTITARLGEAARLHPTSHL